jgi:hypothetical protein
MMEDDGAGGGQQERVEGNRVNKGQQTTTDQQSTIDGSGKGGWGYSCEGKGCTGHSFFVLHCAGCCGAAQENGNKNQV